ncbi:MAG: DUF1592 domain-containing protein [Vicinamibacterales bacterium]
MVKPPSRPAIESASAPKAIVSHAPASTTMLPVEQNAVIKQYCAGCHSDRGKAGGLSLAAFDATTVVDHADTTEKMIRKLRAGMMPPAGARRPEPAVIDALAAAFETRIDRAAALNPNPGSRPSQRLNRAEYARAVKDLLSVDVDVNAYLPADTISDGFDNIADSQTISSTLMEGYLRAASQISRLAVGDRNASAASTTWKVPRTASQMRHVEGAPLGTRGGLSVMHVFPADGDYYFKIMLHMGPTGDLFGGPYRGEQIEVSINGERVALMDINPRMNEQDPNGMTMQTPKVHIKAGEQRLSAAFVQRFDGPADDLIMPIEHTLADTNIGEVFGTTALTHLRDFTVAGPVAVTGVSDTASRRRIFTCRPISAVEESRCATDIVRQLAGRAYRGPVQADDFKELMTFYERGRHGSPSRPEAATAEPRRSSPVDARAEAGDFESGIRMAVQAILASPRFLFRLEQAPAALRAGQTYRITDLDLASRMSFFVWGSVPDAELIRVAALGTLQTPAVFEKQLKRMLADPRSEALSTRFASQWLRLQDVEKVRPDHHFYSYWDTTLSQALVRETELFVDSLIREDRPVTDLLTADHTFVNERLAKHYGIPNILGEEYRRVTIADPNRRGVLGQGSVLLLTSIADRTSPVLRGKWVMEVLLGSPPPAPPPNVPTLDETKAVGDEGRTLSTRGRMEEHRKNPACTSCHKVIDPLGLALENFDVTGVWRIKDNGVAVDPAGDLYDGTKLDGPIGLRNALLKHQDVIMLSFTESLMTYALGRRVESYDMPAVRAIVRDAKRNHYKFSSFIAGVANSGAFRMGRVAAVETTTAAGR